MGDEPKQSRVALRRAILQALEMIDPSMQPQVDRGRSLIRIPAEALAAACAGARP